MLFFRFNSGAFHFSNMTFFAANYSFRQRVLRVLLPIFVACLLPPGCSTNAVTGKSQLNLMSESQEIAMGSKNYLPYQQMEGGKYEVMPELSDYVRTVGQKLVRASKRPGLPYDFVVLNNSVPNAWALPGGKIAVNRGLLTELKSEAELAAVLGHEIVHAAASHTANTMAKGVLLQTAVMGLGMAISDRDYADIIMAGAGLSAGLVGQKFSRDKERESDHYGIECMHKAGYDTAAAVELQETFVRLSRESGAGGGWTAGLFGSHPPSEERVRNNRERLFTYPPGGFRGEKEYQARIAGLLKSKPAYDKLGQGYKALAAGRADEALALAREAAAIEPREGLFHALAAKALAKRRDTRAALAESERAVALNPNYYEFFLLRGQLRQQLGLAGAKEDFAASHRLLPTATSASALGFMALQAGDQRAAVGYLEQAASARTEEGAAAARALGGIYLRQDPSRVLALGAALNSAGRLVVQVGNRSGVPVRDVTVAVQEPGSGRITLVRLPGVIPPGEVGQAATGVGPFDSVEQARRLRMQVQSAQAVGP